MFNHDCIILDASCVIILYASRQMENILDSIPKEISIATFVYKEEVLSINGGPPDNVKQIKESIDLQSLVDAGKLRIVDISSEDEYEMQANLEAILDKGEAISGALAVSRNWAIAIDDKKARRWFELEADHIQILYSLELIRHWTNVQKPSDEIITQALWNVQHRGNYTLKSSHPMYDWWIRYLPEEKRF